MEGYFQVIEAFNPDGIGDEHVDCDGRRVNRLEGEGIGNAEERSDAIFSF